MFPTVIRGIVPPVSNVRIKIQTKGVVERIAPKLLEVEARQRWWLELDFVVDLDMVVLEHILAGSKIRFIEFQSAFYLEHPDLADSLHFHEANAIGTALLAQLNGAIRVLCPPFRGASLKAVVELSADGTGNGAVGFNYTPPAQSEVETVVDILNGRPGKIESLLPVWNTNKNVREVFYYLGTEGSGWADLYKVSEIVEDCSGGGIDAMVRKEWCQKAAWNRFRRSANHQDAIGRFSRHARSRTQPPPDPMTEYEARAFIVALVGNWVHSLLPAEL